MAKLFQNVGRRRRTSLSNCLALGVTLFAAGCPGGSIELTADPAKPLISKAPIPQTVAIEPDFVSLSLDSFNEFQADEGTWNMEGGMIICSGVPKGYLYSKEKYKNLTLRGDFQFVLTEEQTKNSEKANTGFMLAIQEPQKVWPASLEVQGRFDKMGAINTNGGVPAVATVDNPEVRERVRLPADQWNSIEIDFQGGTITSKLNGEVVCTSESTELKEGYIGLQSEGYVVRFRNLRVRRHPDSTKPVIPESTKPVK